MALKNSSKTSSNNTLMIIITGVLLASVIGMLAKSFSRKANKKMYTGKGVSLYGNDLATGLQVWGTDSDDRTHTTILGTTGSGKTEFIFGLVLNQLIRDSGFIAIDAKGDISFQRRTCQLLRAFGREDNLLTIRE